AVRSAAQRGADDRARDARARRGGACAATGIPPRWPGRKRSHHGEEMMLRVARWLPPLVGLLLGCKKKEATVVVYQAIPVERRNIVVSARATGTVQPDTVVEVKSKASGEILDMKAETGETVQRGQLLVRVDQRTPRNTVSQAEAGLEVAKAQL